MTHFMIARHNGFLVVQQIKKIKQGSQYNGDRMKKYHIGQYNDDRIKKCNIG